MTISISPSFGKADPLGAIGSILHYLGQKKNLWGFHQSLTWWHSGWHGRLLTTSPQHLSQNPATAQRAPPVGWPSCSDSSKRTRLPGPESRRAIPFRSTFCTVENVLKHKCTRNMKQNCDLQILSYKAFSPEADACRPQKTAAFKIAVAPFGWASPNLKTLN